MKKIIVALFTCLFMLSFSAKAEEIKWVSMNEALELTKKEPKLIFIDVYTSWCGWCKKMDASSFKDPAVVSYMNKHFYCVKFDAEGSEEVTFKGRSFTNPKTSGKRTTHPFAAILLNNKMTYPSFVILDSQLRGVSMINGYKNASNLLTLLKFFKTEAYKTESLEEFKARLAKEGQK